MKRTNKHTVALTILAVTLAAALTGCSLLQAETGVAPPPDGGNGPTIVSQERAHGDFENREMIFGKVQSIVGNEITIALGTLPGGGGNDENGDGETGPHTVQGFSMGEAPGGGEGPGVHEGPGAGEGPTLNIGGRVIRPGQENDIELEYTGETMTLIIPAGAEIHSAVGSGTLEAISKGSVLNIELNTEGEVPIVERVMIFG